MNTLVPAWKRFIFIKMMSEETMMRLFLLAGSFGMATLISQTAYAEPVTTVDSLMSTTKQDTSMGQVTSVSQLSDVQPTDWAYQALQSLVERYGCIAGYPNSTFRGNRAATRYEMAAALNACLDQISDRFATKEDLETVKALQEEFKAELATLKGRVDSLEARTATLEAQQFSTTTKLQGEAIMAVQYGDRLDTRDSVSNTPSADSRASVLARVRLNFNTSFTGKDLLQTQLEVGNGGQDLFSSDSASLGGRVLGQSALDPYDGGVTDYAGISSEVRLRRLAYTFSPIQGLDVTVGSNVFPSDFIDFNSYANNSAQDFSSGFFVNNSLIVANAVDNPGGAGAGFSWKIGKSPFSIRGAYVAASATNSTDDGEGGGGLFGDPNQGSVELEFARPFGKDDKNNLAVRLQYTHSNTYEDIEYFSNNAATLSGTSSVQQNVIGVNAEATFGRLGIFGRFGYSIDPNIVGLSSSAEPDNIMSWMGGVGVKDLFVPGSLLAVAVGQPFIVSSQDGPQQTNFEGFYRFPINDNISITPTIQVITDVDNQRSDAVVQGLLRATFSF
jgi:Carbohydrate-selective porin, OprB family/S-layer homology domain